MDQAVEVIVPLINPNEPEVQVSALHVREGEEVSQGQLLCTLETTKASNDVHAEAAGFVAGLQWVEGDRVHSGQRLCWISEDPQWSPPQAEASEMASKPADLRITQPAAELARRLDLDPAKLPKDKLVTEAVVLKVLALAKAPAEEIPAVDHSDNRLIIYGGGGHGKSLIDLIRALGSYSIEGIIDDGLVEGEQIMGEPVIGKAQDLPALRERGIQLAANAVGGIGDITRRVEMFSRLIKAGFAFPTLVHPTAFVEPSAELQQGVQVFPHAYIGSDVYVGFGAIVNTAAVVSHDCALEAYANIAPGTLLAGGVRVEEGVLVGMGVSVNLNVRIGAGAMIGNSAVIKSDVPPNQIVRAGQTWPS